MRTTLLLFGFALAACAADPAVIEKGKAEEQRTCLPCHSLRLIHTNRLSRAGWNKELDKMAGWGTKYTQTAMPSSNIWWWRLTGMTSRWLRSI